MKRLLPVLIVALVAAVACSASSPDAGGSQPRSASQGHPRVFLDGPTLKTLRARAKAGSTAWKALQAQCNTYLKGKVEWPDGNDYADPGIGEGYQGSGYFGAVANLGLCYQVTRTTNKKKANAYAARGVDVLTKLSTPAGQHEVDPLRDSGYGIRFYGLGMALGFDWLYPALSSSLKRRIDAALDTWIEAYERDGFEHTFPQGNYFAGYYAAKGIAGLALQGETPHGAGWWSDWLNRVHRQLVQPYYSANLAGGGWPEGWNYGPLGTLNMGWPALAAKTAKGLDLTRDYAFPLASARYALYFTWPSLLSLEDSGEMHSGPNPSATSRAFFAVEAGLLEAFGSPLAPAFHRFADTLRATQSSEGEEPALHRWEEFLFWNPSAAQAPYQSLPLSHLAAGMDKGAVRSSWSTDAVWGSFTAGPYVSYPDAGKEYFDKGALTIVRGGRPFVVNTAGALARDLPGQEDGGQYFGPVYDELFGGNRSLFNVFYTASEPRGQGAYSRADGSRTAMTRFEDGGSFVAMRASHLEDNYPQSDSQDRTISAWTREVVYLRPSVFVVYDRTEVTDPSLDQWLAFHVSAEPHASGSAYDVGSGSTYAGRVQTLLPAGASVRVVDTFDAHKVYRVEIHPGAAAADNRWVTVLDAAASPGTAETSSVLHAGGMDGALVQMPAWNAAVLAGSPASAIDYSIPARATRHVLTDLSPSQTYTVTAAAAGGSLTVHVAPGAGSAASATGVLSFETSPGGAVSP